MFLIEKITPQPTIKAPQVLVITQMSLLISLKLNFLFFALMSISIFSFLRFSKQVLVNLVTCALTFTLFATDKHIFCLSIGCTLLKILFFFILLFISSTWSLLSFLLVSGTNSFSNLGVELNSKLGPEGCCNRRGLSFTAQMCL